MTDKLIIGGHEFDSRFILGSGKFDLELINAAVEHAGAQMITLALRRVNSFTGNILEHIPQGVTLLPNTSGARNAEEAVKIARLAREAGCGEFIKIEVIRDSKYLLPDNYETAKACEMLAKEGFIPMPYMYPDLYAASVIICAPACSTAALISRKRYGKRRSGGYNAPCRTDRLKSGTCDKAVYPHTYRGDRPADNRRRRYRKAVAGLRGYGNGCGSYHGEHRYCHRRKYRRNGESV